MRASPASAGGLESAAPPDPAGGRFPLLDGLRAIAALAIVAYHAGIDTRAAAAGPAGLLLARLDVGVAIFFVLSGFLLYRPFARATLGAAGGRVDLRRYVRSRALRIYPAWLLALAVIGVVLGRIPLARPEIASQYVPLVIGFNPTEMVRHGLYQSWTLTIELTFYAFLPLWWLATRRLVRRAGAPVLTLALAVGALGLAGVALRWWLASVAPGHFLLIALPTQMLPFAIGMLFAVGEATEATGAARTSAGLARVGRRPWACWLVAAGLLLVLAYGTGIPPQLDLEPLSASQEMIRHLLFAAIGAAVVLPGTVSGLAAGGARWLASRPVVALGTVSYGIYLWHTDLLREVLGRWQLGFVAAFVVVLGLAVLTASASYLVVERPVLRRFVR